MSTEKESDVNGDDVAEALEAAGVRFVVTVPDWVQLPLHASLMRRHNRIRTISCCTEHEAFMMAAGLHCGGARAAIVIQNQGLYAGLNALRGAGLDAGTPLVMLIGQFGREAANRGGETIHSTRRIVRLLNPLLDLLEIPTFHVDAREDIQKINQAFSEAETRSYPTAVVFDRNMYWSK